MGANQITRRQAVAAIGSAGAIGLAGCAGDSGGANESTSGQGNADAGGGSGSNQTAGGTVGSANGASGSMKIGILQPVSGDLEYYGQQALWGFFQGLSYKAGGGFSGQAQTGSQSVTVGNVDYELLVRDTQLSADRALSVATDLVQSDEVDMLFGCASSAAATQVASVAQQAQVPTMIGPAASAALTSNADTCNPYLFRASENTAMDARSGGTYVARNSDVSKVFLFGADYSFGRAVVNNYRSVLESEGVEIVGERFVPQGYSEWGGLLDNAESAGAEGIVAGFTVSTLPQLFTTFLNGDYSYRVFGGFATEITVRAIGETLQNALGDLTTQKLKS